MNLPTNGCDAEWQLLALAEWLEVSVLLQQQNVSHEEVVNRLEAIVSTLKILAPADLVAHGAIDDE